MFMAQCTLSSKNQIVIPREAREALGVKAGDKLLVSVKGRTVVLLRAPDSYRKAIIGIGRGNYSADHLAAERDSWS